MVSQFRFSIVLLLYVTLDVAAASRTPVVPELPRAASRTYAQNYKDMVLASCIALAYRDHAAAHRDAQETASALVEWTEFDMERSTGRIDRIIAPFLAESALGKDGHSGFALMKCLDVYHSKELTTQVKQLVPHPTRTYQQDRSAGK